MGFLSPNLSPKVRGSGLPGLAEKGLKGILLTYPPTSCWGVSWASPLVVYAVSSTPPRAPNLTEFLFSFTSPPPTARVRASQGAHPREMFSGSRRRDP